MGDPGDGVPPSLRAGDRVAVVAPSGPVDPVRLERGCAVLRSLGLDVVVGKHALDQNSSGLTYLAGSDAERAADLQQAWCDHDVAQCGYCQAGQLMTAAALLATTPKPSDDEINAAMTGNLCRCATYTRIRAAIKSAAGVTPPPEKSTASAGSP